MGVPLRTPTKPYQWLDLKLGGSYITVSDLRPTTYTRIHIMYNIVRTPIQSAGTYS